MASAPKIGTAQTIIPRANILGIGVSATNMEMALRTIEEWISRRECHYVCATGVHGVMESWRDDDLRRIHNAAGLVVADGVPLAWLSRIMGARQADHVRGSDLMLKMCERSAKRGHSQFFYGGALGVAEKLVSRLHGQFPSLKVTGVYAPPFRSLSPEEDSAIVDYINSAKPDIVWVGISTPKQERWMSEHRRRLDAPVLIGVGAAFDFHAGLSRLHAGCRRADWSGFFV